MFEIVISVLLSYVIPHAPVELCLADARCIPGRITPLGACLSPAIAGVEVTFFLDKQQLGTGRTDANGVAILETGVTPSSGQTSFTASTLYGGKRLEAQGRWFTAIRQVPIVDDHPSGLF